MSHGGGELQGSLEKEQETRSYTASVSETSKSPNQVQRAQSVLRARQRPQESRGFTSEPKLEERPLCPPASNQSSKDQSPSVDTAAAG